MSCAKTSEPIKMPFEGLTHVGPQNHVLDGVQISPKKKHSWGDICRRIITYQRMSALRIVRRPPWANVPAQRRQG